MKAVLLYNGLPTALPFCLNVVRMEGRLSRFPSHTKHAFSVLRHRYPLLVQVERERGRKKDERARGRALLHK